MKDNFELIISRPSKVLLSPALDIEDDDQPWYDARSDEINESDLKSDHSVCDDDNDGRLDSTHIKAKLIRERAYNS